MKNVPKPQNGNYPTFYQRYLDKVPNDGNLVQHLQDIYAETAALLGGLSEEKLLYRYAEGKWSIKELLVHIIDAERIFAYRALRFARADKTNLPGFEEDDYVPESFANDRSIESILAEMSAVRAASISLIEGLDSSTLDRTGSANNVEISVAAVLNLMYGHHKHHMEVLKERYL